MIKTDKIHHCTKCGSEKIRKNSLTDAGKQKYHYKNCGSYGSVEPQKGYSKEERELVLNAYLERTKVDQLLSLNETLVPAVPDDLLELDEAVVLYW